MERVCKISYSFPRLCVKQTGNIAACLQLWPFSSSSSHVLRSSGWGEVHSWLVGEVGRALSGLHDGSFSPVTHGATCQLTSCHYTSGTTQCCSLLLRATLPPRLPDSGLQKLRRVGWCVWAQHTVSYFVTRSSTQSMQDWASTFVPRCLKAATVIVWYFQTLECTV